MTLVFPSPEFDDAVAAVCHGSATDAEMRALNGLLRGDARARDEYLLRVELHSRLASDPDLLVQTGEVRAACCDSAIQSAGQWNTIVPINDLQDDKGALEAMFTI